MSCLLGVFRGRSQLLSYRDLQDPGQEALIQHLASGEAAPVALQGLILSPRPPLFPSQEELSQGEKGGWPS